ncbi:anti-sigma regulatory factor (Ser/Thr protein kinase) [Catenuloplanes nepalensis]|uniref:Anti-sigma regulatory factor (Ser/Thr protein kinase) n=1 Tax=Catenuloplanes nepalensis TaxID=587533 RepID=A0ABT9MLN3_9ACTN|nr:ATP-binding protein [Catenuloplanes nepalensis]MDP9792325.1 anti-sigma regulatory factor (Ser/Thr protein kinase) [Catenuloplanes nepalensis]
MSDDWRMLYAVAADLTALRAFVSTRAAVLGLSEERTELLVLAVSELATNTLQHTGSGGEVTLRTDRGRLVCDVTDSAHDGGATPVLGRPMPPAGALRGRGLAIVEHICDEVETIVISGATRVRIHLDL